MQSMLGFTLQNRWDYINMFIHEGKGHGEDYKKNGYKWFNLNSDDYSVSEANAFWIQINDKSWEKTSQIFKQVMFDTEYLKLFDTKLQGPILEKYFWPYGITKMWQLH